MDGYVDAWVDGDLSNGRQFSINVHQKEILLAISSQ